MMGLATVLDAVLRRSGIDAHAANGIACTIGGHARVLTGTMRMRVVPMPNYRHLAISVRRPRFGVAVMTSREPINIAVLEG